MIRDDEQLLALPYSRRQLIVVEERQPRRRPAPVSAGPNGGRLERVGDAVTDAAGRVRNRLRERRGAKKAEAAGISVLHVELHMAAERLVFPPGHPHGGIVYVADPVRKQVYYSAADFHRKAFERKFADAVHLLMGLGAVELQVVYREGWGREFAGRMDVSSLVDRVRSEHRKRDDKQSEILFEASLDPSDPVVPDGLAWLEHEPSWQGVVNGRRDYGLRDFSLTLSYRDSFRIDSDFEARAKAIGFKAGGQLEEFKQTRWDIQGKFAAIGTATTQGADPHSETPRAVLDQEESG